MHKCWIIILHAGTIQSPCQKITIEKGSKWRWRTKEIRHLKQIKILMMCVFWIQFFTQGKATILTRAKFTSISNVRNIQRIIQMIIHVTMSSYRRKKNVKHMSTSRDLSFIIYQLGKQFFPIMIWWDIDIYSSWTSNMNSSEWKSFCRGFPSTEEISNMYKMRNPKMNLDEIFLDDFAKRIRIQFKKWRNVGVRVDFREKSSKPYPI